MFQTKAESRRALSEILKTHLWMKLLLALFLGVGMGFVLMGLSARYPGPWALTLADWLALPGSLYLTLIQMVIIPLILSSIMLALADISKKSDVKSIATSALIFIAISTIAAAALGIAIVSILKPGVAIQDIARPLGVLELSRQNVFSITPQSILQLIPANPLASLVNGDLMEVLIISLLFGLVLSKMNREKSAIIFEFLEGTQALSMLVITWTIRLAPYAIFGLMIRAVVNSGAAVLVGMLGYVACTFLGFFLIAALYLGWMALLGNNPWTFLVNSKEPLLLAFSLSSSAATMPTTLQTAKEKFDIPPEIAEFLIPMGTALNMAGSALWQSSATLFLAQAFGSQVDLPTIVTIVILTVGASVGTPGIPGAGVGILNTTLRSVGVPASGIPLILGVDRLVDMGCTVINVMGDLVMCKTALWAVQRKQQRALRSHVIVRSKEPTLHEPAP